MAISDNYVPVKELGNGTTTEFGDNWAVLSASFLRVFLENVSTGAQVLQTEGADYTLVFSSSGFTVTFIVAPPSTEFVVISRDVAEDQIVPYRTSKGFQGSVQEDSFDKLTAIDQDQSDEISRSLKFPLGSSLVGSLPTPVDDTSIVWDGVTGAQKNGPTVTDISNASANAAAAAASATAAASSETNAATSETNAAQSAVDAQAAVGAVKVSSNDTTAGDLEAKLLVGAGLSLSTQNDGGNETRTIDTDVNGLVDTVITAADEIMFGDVTDSNNRKKDTVQGILDLVASSGPTLGTPQDTTSGTAFDFTSIPSGTITITITLNGVSLSGSDDLLIQLGDAGGIETSGYVSGTEDLVSGSASSTAGLIIDGGNAAASIDGTIVLTLVDSSTNQWVSSSVCNRGDTSPRLRVSAGRKALSAELTQVRLTRTGSNTFDAGKLNIVFE